MAHGETNKDFLSLAGVKKVLRKALATAHGKLHLDSAWLWFVSWNPIARKYWGPSPLAFHCVLFCSLTGPRLWLRCSIRSNPKTKRERDGFCIIKDGKREMETHSLNRFYRERERGKHRDDWFSDYVAKSAKKNSKNTFFFFFPLS